METPSFTAESAIAHTSVFIECARQRGLVIQAGLDILSSNVETALAQLATNRDAALAAIQSDVAASVNEVDITAIFTAGVDEVHAAAAIKRAGLETELVAADAALGEAIEVAAALAQVRHCKLP